MNWLDEYIANNETGYFEAEDGSFWVAVGRDHMRLAIGEGEPSKLREITRDQFIRKLLGGR